MKYNLQDKTRQDKTRQDKTLRRLAPQGKQDISYYKKLPVLFLTLILFSLTLFFSFSKTNIFKTPWAKKDFPFRVSVNLERNKNSTPTESGSKVETIFILNEKIKSLKKITAVLTNEKGEELETFQAPFEKSYPLVLWTKVDPKNISSDTFLYLKNGSQDLKSPPFLLFDTFEDLWMAGWDTEKINGLPGAKRGLPKSDTGYIVEILAQESTDQSGGPKIILSNKDLNISFERIDGKTFQIKNNEFKKIISFKTLPKEPFYLRIDLPRKEKDDLEFFINGKPVFKSELSKSVNGSITLALLRNNENGVAYFHWIAVREYQEEDAVITAGELEKQ